MFNMSVPLTNKLKLNQDVWYNHLVTLTSEKTNTLHDYLPRERTSTDWAKKCVKRRRKRRFTWPQQVSKSFACVPFTSRNSIALAISAIHCIFKKQSKPRILLKMFDKYWLIKFISFDIYFILSYYSITIRMPIFVMVN